MKIKMAVDRVGMSRHLIDSKRHELSATTVISGISGQKVTAIVLDRAATSAYNEPAAEIGGVEIVIIVTIFEKRRLPKNLV